jgi:diguanylate cyclase
MYKLQKDYEELKIDKTTGLERRDIFEIWFPKAIAMQRRAGEEAIKQISFALFDIDHFKAINDTHGHPIGDVVLGQIGQIIKKTVRRDSDWAFRFGGEEFVVVYVGCNQEKALELAEEIRKAVESTPIALPSGETIYITISGGVTTVNGMKGSLEELKNRAILIADTGLYKSKQNGRNRMTGEKDLTMDDYTKACSKHNIIPRLDEAGKVVFDKRTEDHLR